MVHPVSASALMSERVLTLRPHSPHFGAGRLLPSGAMLHESVRIRQSVKVDQFPPGDGSSVPERCYKPKARSERGEELEGTVLYGI